jgi:hypothetical protein
MRGHEIDRFRGYELCGNSYVAFVFPVFVIHKNDHVALANFLNGLFSST